MNTRPVVGRDAELGVLDGLLSAAMGGSGRIAVVTGAVATGKSVVLGAAADRAAEAGASVLTAVSALEEQSLRFGVLRRLLRCAPLRDAERDLLTRLIAPGTEQAELVHALCDALLDAAARRPLAIVVDDTHWADPESLGFLAWWSRRLRDAAAVLMVAEPDHAASEFRDRALRLPYAHEIRLGPLPPEAVAVLAEQADPALAHATSGGNPLLALALAEDRRSRLASPPPCAPSGPASRARGEGAALAPGRHYARALTTVLHRGPPGVLAAAAALAILATSTSTSTSTSTGTGTGADNSTVADGRTAACASAVGRLLGWDPAETAEALTALATAGLVAEDGGFLHPAARAVVLSAIGPARRAELHQRAADLAYSDGASATVVAEHLHAARRAPTPWAVPVLEEAAGAALAAGDLEPALGYLELAAESCRDEQDLARIRTTLLRAQWRIDPGTPASRLNELAEALHSGHLRGSDALVLVRALLWHGRFDDARDVAARLGESDALADPATVAELRTTEPLVRCSYTPFLDHMPRAEPDAASEPAARRPAAVGRGARRRLEAACALDAVLFRGPSEQVVAAAERILRGARLDDMGMDTVESSLLALTYSERPDRAAPWCDQLLQDAARRRAPSRRARLSSIRAEISFRQGELAAAEDHARRALALVPTASWGVTVGSLLAALVLPLVAMGRHDAALAELGRPVPEEMLLSRHGLHYLHARGRYLLATDSPEPALDDFEACGELMRSWGMDSPGLIAWRVDAAEARLWSGDPDGARRLLDEQLGLCTLAAKRTHGSALRVLAGTREPSQRPTLLRQAADSLQTTGDRYELARTLADLARAYNDAGEQRRGAMIARRARALAVECQAEWLSRSLGAADEDAAPERAESREYDIGALSESEHRVVRLAVEGCTNREIAERLFITISTVEQHLTRIYRKLGVVRRDELAMALATW